MLRTSFAFLALAWPAAARIQPFPGFRTQEIAVGGAVLHVRIGGQGPAVCCFTATARPATCGPLAADLARDHTVIAPDLRGMGLSARPAGGYDKKTQGHDVAGVLDALKVRQGRPRHARHRQYGRLRLRGRRSRAREAADLIDAPLPGVGPWEEITRAHALWHFSFWGPTPSGWWRARADLPRPVLERVLRRPRVLRRRFPRPLRRALRAARRHARRVRTVRGLRPGRDRQQGFRGQGQADHAGAGGGRREIFGTRMAAVARFAASDVEGAVVPRSGHWVMEENPGATIALITAFLAKP